MTSALGDTHDQLTDGLLGDFLDESTGLLQQLNADLLRLDELIKASLQPLSPQLHLDLLNEMFRAAHSLKGLSGMLRFENINSLTHRVENIFDAARNGTLTLTADVVDLVFRSVDRLEAMVAALSEPDAPAVGFDDVYQGIERLLSQSDAHQRAGSQAALDSLLNAVVAQPSTTPLVEPQCQATTCVDNTMGILDDDDIPERYLATFIDETEQTLEELSDLLVAGAGIHATAPLLVNCHRLKGSAASIGLHRIAHVAHRMEDSLQDARSRNGPIPPPLVDAMLACVDAFRTCIAGLKSGIPQDVLDTAYERLHAATCTASDSALSTACHVGAAPTASHADSARNAAPPGKPGWIGRIAFDPSLSLVELKARLILDRLHNLGDLFYQHPSDDELNSRADTTHLLFGIATDTASNDVRQCAAIEGVCDIVIEEVSPRPDAAVPVDGRVAAGPSTLPDSECAADSVSAIGPLGAESTDSVASPRPAVHGKSKPIETLRVDIDRLDQLMNLAGQLVINKARLSQIGSRLKDFATLKTAVHCATTARNSAERIAGSLQEPIELRSSSKIEELSTLATKMCSDLDDLQQELAQLSQMRGAVVELSEAVHQLDRVSDGIQTTVMDTRMVPIGPLFTRFKRVVRDLSRDNHKQIELQICGEGTELDKRMIDELGDPLIHLIRNSADHGIEQPEQRLALGKPAHGTITLNAFQRGNRIVIQVCDDGRGLNAQRIRDKAIAKRLVAEAEAERMSPQQLYQLIWLPGFSTAERVTEVSGRGMGMDIVLAKIEQLNGNVEVVSHPNEGTTFEITLPLTMAIVPSLLTVIDRDVFAIPVESIVEIVQLGPSDLPSVQGRLTARVRDRVISVVELRELFSWHGSNCGAPPQRTFTTLVIVGGDGNELALVVDELLGEQDVVIKSLEENFRNVDGISGASILGDGRVSLILDVNALLTMSRQASQFGGATDKLRRNSLSAEATHDNAAQSPSKETLLNDY